MILPDGWLTSEEADELRRLARGKTVLELGAWKGRSTVVLADVAHYVVSVDRHQGIAEAGGEDSLPDYLAAVRSFKNVAIVIGDFGDVIVRLGVGEFDLVYIDGDHDADSVEWDAGHAMSLRPKTIAFHDWDFDTVRGGAYRVLGREPDDVVGSLASFIL